MRSIPLLTLIAVLSFAAPLLAQTGSNSETPALSEYNDIPPGILLPPDKTEQIQKTEKVEAVQAAPKQNSTRTFKQIMDSYYKGDYVTAYQLLLPLAKNDSAEAQEVLGLMYKMGQGMPKDPKTAAEWLEKAANHARPLAQHHLAYMYFSGEGVTKDEVQALMWIKLALIYYKNGPEKDRAQTDKHNIELHLSRRDRDRANILIKDWLDLRGEGHLLSLDQ